MGSGRTSPCIIHCQNETGDGVEAVVKWRATCGIRGVICEAVASMMADDLDLPIPEAFMVEISAEFARTIPNAEIRDIAERSIGWNFASRKLPPQFATWPMNRPIPLSMRPAAADVFAFDAIIQNPDRRADNPNCLQCGTEMRIFDHDLAFSFLVPIIGWKPPWEKDSLDFLTKPKNRHLFYDGLKGIPLEFGRMAGALEGMTLERISEYQMTLPDEWRNDTDALKRICEYLLELKKHLNETMSRIVEVLK